jgi:hypothetical protein
MVMLMMMVTILIMCVFSSGTAMLSHYTHHLTEHKYLVRQCNSHRSRCVTVSFACCWSRGRGSQSST